MNIDNQSLYAQLGLTPPAAAVKKQELGQGDFLRLMTEQLKHQDPLKPLESTAFLGQLAQFSSVQGIQQLNANFSSLASAVETDRALQGASLVGHDVLVSGDSFRHEGSGVAGEVETPSAGTVSVDITDASGALVHHLSVVAKGAGSVAFEWDGRLADGAMAPSGNYHVAASVNSGAKTEALQSQLVARVESVSLAASGLVLNLSGIGATPLSAIRRIG